MNSNHDTLLSVNTPHMPEILNTIREDSVVQLKDNRPGLSLLTWFVHPESYEFLASTRCTECVRFQDLEKNTPFLMTILDLNQTHLPYLKELRAMVEKHVQNHYGYVPEKDVLRIFFHFPTSARTASLHLHVRINQNILPLERARSYTLSEVVNYLERGKTTQQLILDRQETLGGNSVVDPGLISILRDVEKNSLKTLINPFYDPSLTH